MSQLAPPFRLSSNALKKMGMLEPSQCEAAISALLDALCGRIDCMCDPYERHRNWKRVVTSAFIFLVSKGTRWITIHSVEAACSEMEDFDEELQELDCEAGDDMSSFEGSFIGSYQVADGNRKALMQMPKVKVRSLDERQPQHVIIAGPDDNGVGFVLISEVVKSSRYGFSGRVRLCAIKVTET